MEDASGDWSVGGERPPHSSSGMGGRKFSIQLGGVDATVAPRISRGIGGIGVDIGIVFISGGTSYGLIPTLDKGGAIYIVGGFEAAYNGRILNLMSGLSGSGFSREVMISTYDADTNGINSWNISLGTGFAVDGISGTAGLISGNSLLGPGGDVNIAIGPGKGYGGGNFYLTAGSTYGDSISGDAMEIFSGMSSLSNLGGIRIGSPDSGTIDLSDSVQIQTGGCVYWFIWGTVF